MITNFPTKGAFGRNVELCFIDLGSEETVSSCAFHCITYTGNVGSRSNHQAYRTITLLSSLPHNSLNLLAQSCSVVTVGNTGMSTKPSLFGSLSYLIIKLHLVGMKPQSQTEAEDKLNSNIRQCLAQLSTCSLRVCCFKFSTG